MSGKQAAGRVGDSVGTGYCSLPIPLFLTAWAILCSWNGCLLWPLWGNEAQFHLCEATILTDILPVAQETQNLKHEPFYIQELFITFFVNWNEKQCLLYTYNVILYFQLLVP